MSAKEALILLNGEKLCGKSSIDVPYNCPVKGIVANIYVDNLLVVEKMQILESGVMHLPLQELNKQICAIKICISKLWSPICEGIGADARELGIAICFENINFK